SPCNPNTIGSAGNRRLITTYPATACGEALVLESWNLRRQISEKIQRLKGSATIDRDTRFYLNRRVEIGEENVAEIIGSELAVATGKAEGIAVRDCVLFPGRTSIRTPAMGSGTTFEVRNTGYLRRVGMTDREGGFGLVSTAQAYVNIFWTAPLDIGGRRGGRIVGKSADG